LNSCKNIGIKNNVEEINDEDIEERDLGVRSAKEESEEPSKVETETEEVLSAEKSFIRSKEGTGSKSEKVANDEGTNEQVERDDNSEELANDLDEDGEEEHDRENALYLTKMLSDKEGEAYSKLRMCIVQEGESLDVIAKRYSIEVSQLKRMNRLKDETVSDGQILYIPVRQSS